MNKQLKINSQHDVGVGEENGRVNAILGYIKQRSRALE